MDDDEKWVIELELALCVEEWTSKLWLELDASVTELCKLAPSVLSVIVSITAGIGEAESSDVVIVVRLGIGCVVLVSVKVAGVCGMLVEGVRGTTVDGKIVFLNYGLNSNEGRSMSGLRESQTPANLTFRI